MLLPLESVNHGELIRMLARQYDARSGALEFVPKGADSWCYRLDGLWVSVRRDLRGHLPEAYEAAVELSNNGLEFVLAPLVGRDGQVSRMVSGHPVVVFPYVPATVVGARCPGVHIGSVADLLARLHRAATSVPLPVERYDLPFEDDLRWALDTARSGVRHSGPFTEPMRDLIRTNTDHLTALHAEFTTLARRCAAAAEPPVPTHGEPGQGNVLHRNGALLLADWGELMMGPPERDWYHLARSFGQRPRGRPEFLRFYEIRWVFNELTEYAVQLMAPHTGNAEDQESWYQVQRCLAVTS